MTTLRDVFQAGFGPYAKGRNLPYRIFQAANAIMNCRTAAMGGHVQHCENGHLLGVHYNSCRHRSCPQCNERSKSQWADAQAARLLACEHYHVIFTLPHELLDLWSYNRGSMADLLFSSATDALMTLLNDERHLGATPGIVASLHTWGRTLSRHPHVHCLVTGGGLDGNGEWRSTHKGYLLPLKVLKPVFRGKFLSRLEDHLKKGKLRLPSGVTPDAAHDLLRAVARKDWNIRIQERYAHGRGVMRYLARYVRGGPISNQRLMEAPSTAIRFWYQDHRDGKTKRMTLSRDEFISRVLWHVPESRRHTTRYYGLYGHKAGPQRSRCRALLGQPAERKPEKVDWRTYLEHLGEGTKTRCPACGAPIQHGSPIHRSKGRVPISIGRRLRIDFVQPLDEVAASAVPITSAGMT